MGAGPGLPLISQPKEHDMNREGIPCGIEEVPGGIFQEAQQLAARIGTPGCYAFTDARLPATRLAANGFDQIIDHAATLALYAEPPKRIDPG
jgi:hypothetical protein